jgi:hypothetical protein
MMRFNERCPKSFLVDGNINTRYNLNGNFVIQYGSFPFNQAVEEDGRKFEIAQMRHNA